MERYITSVIRRKQKGIGATLLRPLLFFLSLLYRFVIALRNFCYNRALFKTYRSNVPVVVSVGNIVAGGTGKTPFTLMLAQALSSQGKVAIVSRGYRSQAEKGDSPVIVCLGEGPLLSPAVCGDEPYLLASRFSEGVIFAGKNRRKGLDLAMESGVKFAILEDGFQHRQVVRDFDVVIVDAENPFGFSYFLPRGFLREHPKGLARANLIVVNHVKSREQFEECQKKIKSYSSAPVIGTRMDLVGWETLEGETISSIKGKKVGAFCGIAHPEKFFQFLRGCGADLVAECAFSDHAYYDDETVSSLAHDFQLKGVELVVCTEKDRVKLKKFSLFSVPTAFCQMELKVVENFSAWEEVLSKIFSSND